MTAGLSSLTNICLCESSGNGNTDVSVIAINLAQGFLSILYMVFIQKIGKIRSLML